MPSYYYKAKSSSGETKSGVLDAKSEQELARSLREEGYILISAETEKTKDKKRAFSFGKVSILDKMMFTKNLGVMIRAGISLPRSLRTLAGQARSKKFSQALNNIADEISKGKSFSQALSNYPGIFSEIFVNMVQVGEEGGTLEEALKTLSSQMEKEHELKSKLIGAMIYPAVVVLAMVGIGSAMLILVVPGLAVTFDDLGIELPVTTIFVIGIGNFLANYWHLIPVIFLVLYFLFKFLMKMSWAKSSFDYLLLRIPVVSPIVKKTNTAYAIRTLSSLITSGVPIVRSLEIISNSLSNAYFKKSFLEASQQVRKGSKLTDSLKKYENLYSSLVIQMIEVGEETGETADILKKLAEFFEEEVINTTKNLSAVVEPVLMLLVGGAVGFFAVSMIQPIYSMIGAF